VVFLTILVAFWVALNCLLLVLGKTPIDEPPFYWMQGAMALTALYMTIFILTTQRRENELASRHEQLTLELAMLSEQKAAKIISLLEELRQDHPEIRDRIDREAAAMSSADSRSILEALKEHTNELTSDCLTWLFSRNLVFVGIYKACPTCLIILGEGVRVHPISFFISCFGATVALVSPVVERLEPSGQKYVVRSTKQGGLHGLW
jgi:hypothetical protein